MASQWDNFLHNLGTWLGSFTHVNLAGEILSDIPSILMLSNVDGNKNKARIWLRRYGNGGFESEPSNEVDYTFENLGRHTIFFENGAFSKGSMCLTPISQFIAEYGFIEGDRRLRMVQIYGDEFKFDKLVFIREYREGTQAVERPQLQVEQLLGTWEGTYISYGCDQQPAEAAHSQLTISKSGDRLVQNLTLPTATVTSVGTIQGSQVLFGEEKQPRQLVLLPDGASMLVPAQLKQREAFFVEAGWLLSPNDRQRIIRHYDAQGEWCGSTFVHERRAH